MRSHSLIWMIAAVLPLAGCATARRDKPLLTARASARIAADCGAVGSKFHRDRPRLPYVVFVMRPDQLTAADDTPTPTVRCLGKGLEAHRHAMMSLRGESAGH